MFCSKCGKEIEDKSVFCKHCGNKTLEETQKIAEKKIRKPEIIWGGIFGIIIISMAIIGKSVYVGLVYTGLIAFIVGITGLIKGNIQSLRIKNRKTALMVIVGGLILMGITGAAVSPETPEKKRKGLAVVKQKMEQQKKYDREHIDELYQQGLDAIEEKKWDEALKFLNRVKKVNPDYKEVNKYLEKSKLTKIPAKEKRYLQKADEVVRKISVHMEKVKETIRDYESGKITLIELYEIMKPQAIAIENLNDIEKLEWDPGITPNKKFDNLGVYSYGVMTMASGATLTPFHPNSIYYKKYKKKDLNIPGLKITIGIYEEDLRKYYTERKKF